MKKTIIVLVIVAGLAAAAFYSGLFNRSSTQTSSAQGGNAPGGPPGAGGPGGRRGGRGFGGPAGPMTVELATVSRAPVAEQLTVVGNLIGDATVTVVPKTAGRLQDVYVRLGDRVSRGQRIAKIEDQDTIEQVKQAEAAFEVAKATIRQRDADLALAQTNVERSRNLFSRQLLPQQTLDENESRYQAAVAQLDLARAQNTQSQARLDELRINLANTIITSPVDGFVARRAADPGAFVSQNAPVADVVDIRRVRLVVNVVEKDLRQVNVYDTANVEVDAFPGEHFTGRIARVAPVLDQATRTASVEIEIANPDYRLKPGMYARVRITTANRKDALVVPANTVVDVNGRRGVFVADNNMATFRAVRIGIEEPTRIEILDGVTEGERVVTTGAGALTDGARINIAGQNGDGRRGGLGARGAPPNANGGEGRGASSAQAPGALGRRGRPEAGEGEFNAPPNGGGVRGDGTGRRGFGGRGRDGEGSAP